MSEQAGGPGWWLASDGKWYPPEAVPASPVPTSPPSPAESPSPVLNRSTGDKVMLAGALALVIGAFLPWAEVGPFSKAGTSGDGVFTLVLGLVIAWLVYARRRPVIVVMCAVLALVIGVVDLVDIQRLAGDSEELFSVDVGTGLILTVAGAAAAVVGWLLSRRRT